MGKPDKPSPEARSSDRTKPAERKDGPRAGAGDRPSVRRQPPPDKPASHSGAKTSRDYKPGDLRATGKENWKSERRGHTERAEKAGRAEVKAATGKDVKIAGKEAGRSVQHHHHAGVSESKKVGLNPNVAGEKERLTAVHSSRSDKTFARQGDKPDFDPKADKGRVTHHTQASRLDRAEQARAAKALGVKGDNPRLPATDAGRKALVDASGTSKWRWPVDQTERDKQTWTRREPAGPKVDSQGRVAPDRTPAAAGKVPRTDTATPGTVRKPDAPKPPGSDALGKLGRATGIAGRLGGLLNVFGIYKDTRDIVAREKPEWLREGSRVPLYRPVRDLPIMKEPTGYTVEKKDGKVIYRDPDGNVCPKDEAIRSTSSNYGGRA